MCRYMKLKIQKFILIYPYALAGEVFFSNIQNSMLFWMLKENTCPIANFDLHGSCSYTKLASDTEPDFYYQGC